MVEESDVESPFIHRELKFVCFESTVYLLFNSLFLRTHTLHALVKTYSLLLLDRKSVFFSNIYIVRLYIYFIERELIAET